MVNDGIPPLLVGFAALIVLGVTVYWSVHGLSKSLFSTLYWLSLAAVISVPLCIDLAFGLPDQAFAGRLGYIAPFAKYGIHSAAIFAAGHVLCTSLVYFWVAGRFMKHQDPEQMGSRRQAPWPVWSSSVLLTFGAVFALSSLIIINRRWDLSRSFNDFLDPSSAPTYEIYFFFASTPLISILYDRGQGFTKYAIVVGSVSVIVAYFLGIRYFMFPFIGYLAWVKLIDSDRSLREKFRILLTIGVIAWVAFTIWGVIRGLGIRGDPLAILRDPDLFSSVAGYSFYEQLVLGNEFGTRLGFYDLVARLNVEAHFRGMDSMWATLISSIYPFILRILGTPIPVSNAKLIYEIQSGIIGSGVSSGTTAFGSDWFTWGWWGMPIGGAIMGILLAVGDILYLRRGTSWLLIGPMWTYQLIFLARGGTDVWLGLWGRFLPLALLFLALAHMLDRIFLREEPEIELDIAPYQ